MADNPKGTVYQNLNRMLNLDGFGFETNPIPNQNISKIIIKGTSPDDIRRKGLELQQKRELENKFFRTTDRGFQKALQYEAARLPAYLDYEGMEYYPLIASALDLFMEEATTIGTNGKMLNIYSNKERIKFHLEELFNDIVNVNVNLPFWTRNVPVKYDSMIPLLNGEIITIKEIAERLKINPEKEIWTYSIQDSTKKIVPGKIMWCDLTRKNSEILKITLDDNNYLETAPDHEFMLRNGKYKRADELNVGDSLMPFYTKISDKKTERVGGYEKIYNPQTNFYKFTHTAVSHECLRDFKKEKITGKKFLTHHINFNKFDNSPSNLSRMSFSDHATLHQELNEKNFKNPEITKKRMLSIDKYLRSQSRKDKLSKEMSGIYSNYFKIYNNSSLHNEHNIIRKNRMLELWSDENYQTMVKDKMQLKFNDECLNYVIDILKNSNIYIGCLKLGKILMNDSNFMLLFKKANNDIRKNLNKSLNSTTLYKIIYRKTHKSYCDFGLSINPNFINETNFKRACSISKKHKHEENLILNHKVLSVEKISEKYDVYCMEVVGKNNEQDRHNFPVCAKNEKGEYSRNGVFLSNCKYGDNFVLLYGVKKKGITHLKQMVNYEVERLERINEGKPTIKFKERLTGDEFNIFEVAHFRLLGDDKYLPYGSSILNKVRRVFRQLVLAEDAMLTYRILRAGEKKVFKIDVGNIDEDDIEEYIFKVATKFKKATNIYPDSGQIDYRFNILGNDEDYFLPVRNANVQTGIDTLPGAQNLDQIHDIEYLRDNLYTGLGVPKPFLSFQDAAGAGKSMAQYDIRFAKKVNRIQQAMIQELNKIAIIHLYLLGFDKEDLGNFTLSLTNPSTQLELLKSELFRDKAQTYAELTRNEGGIAAMSHTEAKRILFNMSDKEIIADFKKQRMEKALAQELTDTPLVIKRTTVFDDIDKKYGDETALAGIEAGTGGTSIAGGGKVPSAGGGGGAPEIGGGAGPPTGAGGAGGEINPTGEFATPAALPPPTGEGVKKRNVLIETKFNDLLEELVYGTDNKPEIKKTSENKQIIHEIDEKNNQMNQTAFDMINEIDDLLKITESTNFPKKDDIENIDLKNIDLLDDNKDNI